MKKVVLAGGTGLIGQFLEKKYKNLGYNVIIISRQAAHIQWHNTEAVRDAINGTDLLINLAGYSVNCRYNDKNKALIMNSRVETTTILGEAILQCSQPPKLWINSSTATIYRHAEDHYMTEAEGEIGTGFSVEVAKAWEKSFFQYKMEKTRQVALRISIVFGTEAELVSVFKTLTKLGAGGKQGSGKQMFSWVHIEDVYRIINYVEEHESIIGPVNCASPQAVTNAELMKKLRKQLGMPFGIPAPKWLLNIGAVVIRTEPELVLKSRWVYPELLLNHGFRFEFDTIDKTLKDVF